MSISTSSLFRDSLHFMRNQLTTTLLLSLWAALFTVCMKWVLQLVLPSHRSHVTLSLLEILSTHPLLTLAPLVSYPLLAAPMLLVLQSRSKGYTITARQALIGGLAHYPALFTLELVTDIITVSGLLLMVIPGLVMMIRCSLAPCILITTRQRVPSTLLQCWRLTASCWFPLLAGYLLIFFGFHLPLMWLLSYCSSLLFNNAWLQQLLAHLLLNITHCWLLIYQFRLYMQLPKPAIKKELS